MRTKPKWIFALLLFLLLAAPISGEVNAQGLQQLAKYQAADRQQVLVEGAKKEGTVVFYTFIPPELVGHLTEPFEKKYGIKVQIWRSRTELILQRAMMEARAGKHAVDLILNAAVPLESMRREQLLQEVYSPYQTDLMPFAVPQHREWVATQLNVRAQVYNTNLVRKADLPKTYQDLLDPKWKGRLAIEATDHEWVSSVISDMGHAEGVKYFQALFANGLSTRTGRALLNTLVGSGEVPLALTILPHATEESKRKGSPIDWFVIEPAVATPSGIAIPKRVPHPHAALLFYDYILSPEGQRILAHIGYTPTNPAIDNPLKGIKIKLLDVRTLYEEQEKSNALYESIKQGKR